MERLFALARKPERLVVGLNSGTSVDGVDAALVRFRGTGADVRLEVLGAVDVPHPAALRARLLRAPDLSCVEVCALHRELADVFADAAFSAARAAGVPFDDVDLVGSHGQTICHLPDPAGGAATLQIGDLDRIAARTGKVVVGDFRAADVAAGGAGAPLMPYLDLALFGREPGVLTLNLGGITAVSWLPGPRDGATAFDVGPCNVALDLLAAAVGGPSVRFDPDGAFAAAGRVARPLLARLLAHPFFHAAPPKTSGRETFGRGYVADLLRDAAAEGLDAQDVLATHTELVGASVAAAVDRWIPGGRGAVRRVVAGGGGVRNRTLMDGLRRSLAPVPVVPIGPAEGVAPEAKEAVLFALLAHERLCGTPSNVPRATGAGRAVQLGKIAGG